MYRFIEYNRDDTYRNHLCMFTGRIDEIDFIIEILKSFNYQPVINFLPNKNGLTVDMKTKSYWSWSNSTISKENYHNKIPDYIREYLSNERIRKYCEKISVRLKNG